MAAKRTTFLEKIDERGFQEAKSSLKKYAPQKDSQSLSMVPDSGGLFGLGNYKVTGTDLNTLTSQIQKYFINNDTRTQAILDEFGQIYNAFEALDKDYIAGFVKAFNAVEKVKKEEEKDRADLKKTFETLEKTVEALQQFKKDIENLKHINDIDKVWKLIYAQKEISDSLVAYREELCSLNHIMDTDDIWQDVETIKTEFKRLKDEQDEAMVSMAGTIKVEKASLQEAVGLLKQKIRTAYIVAGSAAVLALISFVLNIIGVI